MSYIGPKPTHIYQLIGLVFLISVVAWFGVNDWKIPEVLPYTGPGPGEVFVKPSFSAAPLVNQNAPSVNGVRTSVEAPVELKKGSIVVVDQDGDTLQGVEAIPTKDIAQLVSNEPWELLGHSGESSFQSNESGELPPMPSGRVLLRLNGFAPKLVYLVDDQKSRQIQMTLAAGQRVVVSGTDGRPISQASIFIPSIHVPWGIAFPADSFVEVAKTNQAGEATLWSSLPPNTIGVIASSGFAPKFMSFVEPLSLDSTSIILHRAVSIEGRVVGADASSARFSVRAESSNYMVLSEKYSPFTRVKEDGTFRLSGLPDGFSWTLAASLQTGSDWVVAGQAVEAVAPSSDIVLTISKPVSLSLSATSEDGSAVRVNVLSALLPPTVLASAEDTSCIVGKDGRSTWPSIPWMAHPSDRTLVELWAQAPGYRPAPLGRFNLESGKRFDLGMVVLEEAKPWSISVVDKVTSEGVPGAIIRYLPDRALSTRVYTSTLLQEVLTDEHGHATLICPLGISGYLQVSSEGWIERQVEIDGSSCEQMEIELYRPALVAVLCADGKGNPVGSTTIQWRGSENPKWSRVVAGPNGVVHLETSQGEIQIRHSPGALRGSFEGGGTITLDVHHQAEGEPRVSQTVTVSNLLAGEYRFVELVVPAMAELSLHITQNGMPAEGCRVIAVPGTRLDIVANDLWSVLSLPKAIVPPDGSIVLRGVPTGNVMLSVILPESGFVAYQIFSILRPFAGAIPVPVETGQRSIRLLDQKETPIAGALIALRQASFQDGIRMPPMISVTPSGKTVTSGRALRIATAVTDEGGIAYFDHVPWGGKFNAGLVNSEEYPFVSTIELDAFQKHGVLKSGSGASLRVHFTWGTDGAPGGALAVVVRNVKTGETTNGTANERGEYATGGLLPGSYRIGVPVLGKWFDVELIAGREHIETVLLR